MKWRQLYQEQDTYPSLVPQFHAGNKLFPEPAITCLPSGVTASDPIEPLSPDSEFASMQSNKFRTHPHNCDFRPNSERLLLLGELRTLPV